MVKSIGFAWGVVLFFCALAWAHPGSTDRYGCHVDEDGYYHCHP